MEKVYVKNDDKMVYEVSLQRHGGAFYHLITLELVCGWDYVNPDENDIQGYVKPERFVDGVQYESLTFYPLDETILGRLEEEGYKRVYLEELGIENFLGAI